MFGGFGEEGEMKAKKPKEPVLRVESSYSYAGSSIVSESTYSYEGTCVLSKDCFAYVSYLISQFY